MGQVGMYENHLAELQLQLNPELWRPTDILAAYKREAYESAHAWIDPSAPILKMIRDARKVFGTRRMRSNV